MTSHFMKSDIDTMMHTDRKRVAKKPVFHPYEKKIDVNKNQKSAFFFSANMIKKFNRISSHKISL